MRAWLAGALLGAVLPLSAAPEVPRDPPKFLGASGLAALASGAISMAIMGVVCAIWSRDAALAPVLSFAFGAVTVRVLLRVQRPSAGRRLYLGPILAGLIAGPLAGAAMASTWHIGHGPTAKPASSMIAALATGLLLGPLIAVACTPIAVAARDWAHGPFDRALYTASCVTVIAGLLTTVVDAFAGRTIREDAALVVLGAVGLGTFVLRASRPPSPREAPAAGPFRSAESPAAPIARSHRPRIAVVLAIVALATVPIAHRVQVHRAEHARVRFSYEPTPVAGLDANAKNLIAPNHEAACAQRGDGTPVCWGNYIGRSLVASFQHVRTPTPRAGIGPVARYAVDGARFCVLPEIGGRVRCAMAEGPFVDVGPPHAIDVATHSPQLFVLTRDGEVWDDIKIEGLPRAAQLRVSHERACIVAEEGSVYCWRFGERPTRSKVPGPADRVALSRFDTMARTRDGKWWHWSNVSAVADPEPLADSDGLAEVVMSDGLLCRHFENGALRCSPSGSGFDLTNLPPGSVTEVAASDALICAKMRDGVSCWESYGKRSEER